MNIFRLLITTPLGYILGWINQFVGNYGVAIILFTILIKLVLLPLGLKQQKSMTKMQRVQPKIKEIQEKYKYDQNKASQETMKIYKEYGVNPSGGCLPLLIQFPILIGLYQVIYRPLTYILHMSAKDINALKSGMELSKTMERMAEIVIAKAQNLLNFDFLGLDLSVIPWSEGALKSAISNPKLLAFTIIPILAAVTTFLTSKITTMMNKPKEEDKKPKAPERVLSPDPKKAASDSGNAEAMTNSMTYFMPFMTLWFALTLPSALGLYWIISNVLSLGQTVLLNGYYNEKLTKEIAEEDEKREQKILEKQKKYNITKKKRR